MPVILETQKTTVGRLWSEAGLGKSVRPYGKKKTLKAKGLGGMAQVKESLTQNQTKLT
jgi:hypothetical protein